MKIAQVVQGSDAWHQFRLDHFGASEAAAMLGLSKNVTRTELLTAKSTGIAREFSDFVQKRVLDHGHEVEARARPIIEAQIDEELYPVTCEFGRLSASCDGLTLGGELAFEHKQWNVGLAESVAAGIVPDDHMPQCQQILLVTGANKVLFVVSDGTEQNMVQAEVLPDPAWFQRLERGWHQFAEDLKTHVPAEIAAEVVAAPVESLPVVSVRMEGSIAVISNLTLFGAKLKAFIEKIDTKPNTDQAFADAEAAIKTLQTAQDALEHAESAALSETASVEEMRRTVADYAGLARSTRLMLEKVVKARKEQIKVEIVQEGRDLLQAHIAGLNTRLGKPYMPTVPADFAGVIKGKKTVTSLRDAMTTELARAKIEANAIAERIQINLATLRELASAHAFLFADTALIVLKPADDLTTLVKFRVKEHEDAEEKKREDARKKLRADDVAGRIDRLRAWPANLRDTKATAAATAERMAQIRAVEINATDFDDRAAEAEALRVDVLAALQTLHDSLAAAEAQAAAPAPAPVVVAAAPPPTAPVPPPAPVSYGYRSATPAPAPASTETLTIGQINARLQASVPISVDAAGVIAMGFAKQPRPGSGSHFLASDFDSICDAISARVLSAKREEVAA